MPRSEVELVNAEQTLIKAENSYEITVAKLRNIIKNSSTDKLELTDELLLSEFTQDLATCKIIAKEKRPEINKLKIAITQSEKDIKIAKADKIDCKLISWH